MERHRVLFEAAAIAAHARFSSEGFRQKDVRFLLEFFSNWVESAIEGPSLPVQNIQISRYLESLVREGFAKRAMAGKQPRYRLTRVGLMECLARIVHRRHWWPIEEFLFVLYFVDSYHERIHALIKNEGALFPSALRLEIYHLLNLDSIFETQLRLLEREIEKLELRISECNKSSALAKSLIAKGTPPEQLVREIQEKFPYQLNNQKPLSELFRETPQENWLWEMETGTKKRVTQIFAPLRDLLIHLRDQIQLLRVKSGRARSSIPSG